VRGGACRDGGGDGPRWLHLRSWGAAPGGCNASRDCLQLGHAPRGGRRKGAGCCAVAESVAEAALRPGVGSPVLSGEAGGGSGGALGVALGLVWEGEEEAGWH
jgi:hypothetical protein